MKHPKSYDSTPETRKRMSKVKLKGGKAETLLAEAIWHQGYRYRKNDKRLPGSPDIAILKYHIAVFVDGEFWHGKDWETRKMRLKRNREYWIEKNRRKHGSRPSGRPDVDAGWMGPHSLLGKRSHQRLIDMCCYNRGSHSCAADRQRRCARNH